MKILTVDELLKDFDNILEELEDSSENVYVKAPNGKWVVLMGERTYRNTVDTLNMSYDNATLNMFYDTALLDHLMTQKSLEEVIEAVQAKIETDPKRVSLPEDYYSYLLMLARSNYKMNKRLRTDIRRLIGDLREVKDIIFPYEAICKWKKTGTRDDLNGPIQGTDSLTNEHLSAFKHIADAVHDFYHNFKKK